MPYIQNIENCMADRIGEQGLTEDQIDGYAAGLTSGIADLRAKHDSGALPLLRLPSRTDDFADMAAVAEKYRNFFEDVVVLGTGGSSLGGRALYTMTDPDKRGLSPRLHIVTNVDPFGFNRVMRHLDRRKTGWIVISKSGGTAETLMQFLSVLPLLRSTLGDERLKDHVTIITEPGDNPLRKLAAEFSLPVLDHDPKVGGRYSVLSVVGMLPALIAGIDAEAVRGGAGMVLEKTLHADDPLASPPALGAAISVGLNKHHAIMAHVMLAYSDRLGSLSRWYRQLWAESLGKNGEGTTPIYGTGPVDQHSQLQLWLDGPKDKMFTVLSGPLEDDDEPAPGGVMPVDADLATLTGMNYLSGRTLAELMDASRRGTAETLAEHGKPVRTIHLEAIDETSMGAMMMHFMLETILSAHLLDVDPFDQPAVEHGKNLTRQYLFDLQKA